MRASKHVQVRRDEKLTRLQLEHPASMSTSHETTDDDRSIVDGPEASASIATQLNTPKSSVSPTRVTEHGVKSPAKAAADTSPAGEDVLPSKPASSASYCGSSLAQEFAEKFGLTEDALLRDAPLQQRSPLSWFGVMVPPYLRSCQGSFENALEAAVKLAELQCQMQQQAFVERSTSQHD